MNGCFLSNAHNFGYKSSHCYSSRPTYVAILAIYEPHKRVNNSLLASSQMAIELIMVASPKVVHCLRKCVALFHVLYS